MSITVKNINSYNQNINFLLKGGEIISSNHGSVVNQTKRALNNICVFNMSEKHRQENNIPMKKKKAKKMDVADRYIFSISTMERYLQANIQFSRYCKKKYNIKMVNEITKEMAVSYLEKRKNEVAAGTLQNDRAALNKFDTAIVQSGWKSKHDPSFQIRDEVDIPERKVTDRQWGGRYTDQEIKKIKNYLSDHSPSSLKVVQLQEALGLRISEALGLRGQDIDTKAQTAYIRSKTAKNGRSRVVDIPESFIGLLVDMKKQGKLITGTKERNTQHQIKNACRINNITIKKNKYGRGSHGVRAAASYRKLKYELKKREVKITKERFDQLLNEDLRNLSENEYAALKSVSKFLGHNRVSIVRKHYLTQ